MCKGCLLCEPWQECHPFTWCQYPWCTSLYWGYPYTGTFPDKHYCRTYSSVISWCYDNASCFFGVYQLLESQRRSAERCRQPDVGRTSLPLYWCYRPWLHSDWECRRVYVMGRYGWEWETYQHGQRPALSKVGAQCQEVRLQLWAPHLKCCRLRCLHHKKTLLRHLC